MITAGIDGCRAGWLFFRADENGLGDAGLARSGADLWRELAGVGLALIDIPIGLLDEGRDERACDVAARVVLARRKSSVFRVPVRAAVYAPDYRSACAVNQQRAAVKLSRQAWGVVPKIRQIDELLTAEPRARQVLREVHPEVLFWALACGQPMSLSKKTAAGREERLQLLATVWPPVRQLCARVRRRWPRKWVADDDILDALVAALAAHLGAEELQRLPGTLNADAHGVPMQIVFWSPCQKGVRLRRPGKPV